MLFIADLHLEPRHSGSFQLALRYLKQARQASSLYILGDLFEYWIGDDVGIEMYTPVITALKELSDAGCQVTVMLGNRDFLLGKQFSQATAATLVTADELVIQQDGHSILLMHGDTLCSDDAEYQRFRTLVRSESWQSEFLALSPAERVTRATALRETSKSASASKQQSIMDVNQERVLERMQANNCKTLIHGHTHRPQVHSLPSIDGSRYVVGDWHADHSNVVEYSDGQFKLLPYTS